MNPNKFISLYKYLGANHGVARLAVLEAADGRGNLSRIAEELNCTTASMTATVSSLESDGYLKRERVPGDRRQCKLTLTDKGARYLRLAHDTVECPKVKPEKNS